MYKPADKTQTSFLDFDQPMGLHMNPDNRWIQMAHKISWDRFEVKYADLFPSDTGNVAKLLRMALGALIIQSRFQFPDRELVEQITENPYLQYFIGLPGYQETPPFDAGTLVLFRKRITADMLVEANEYLLAHKDDSQSKPPSSGKGTDENSIPKKEEANKGTLAIDATCAPPNIRYPQDISLLNEAREKLEQMIYRMCKAYGLQLPRATAGEQGKTTWLLPGAGNTPKSRYVLPSGNSFPMYAGTLGIWKVISARAVCRIPKIFLLS